MASIDQNRILTQTQTNHGRTKKKNLAQSTWSQTGTHQNSRICPLRMHQLSCI